MGPADSAGANRVVPQVGGHQRFGGGGAHLLQFGLLNRFGWAVLDSARGVEAGEWYKQGFAFGAFHSFVLCSFEESCYKMCGSMHRPLCKEIFAALQSRVKEQVSAEVPSEERMDFLLFFD